MFNKLANNSVISSFLQNRQNSVLDHGDDPVKSFVNRTGDRKGPKAPERAQLVMRKVVSTG